MIEQDCFLSIDVGTRETRAALISPDGQLIKKVTAPIYTWLSDRAMEQSSEDIWQQTSLCIRSLMESIQPSSILGIGVDATASMVLLDQAMTPVAISIHQAHPTNVLGWMDRRSQQQATALAHQLPAHLREKSYQSAEAPLPKLLWLKQACPDTWQQCHIILDLYDFLTYKLTGILYRSQYSFLTHIQNEILQHLQISPSLLSGDQIDITHCVGSGVSSSAAKVTGLQQGTPLAPGIVDGAGGSFCSLLASDETALKPLPTDAMTQRLSMIVGTSTIYTATGKTPRKVEGTWGPVPSIVTGYYHTIVGQTAAGALLQHVVTTHPAYTEVSKKSKNSGLSIDAYLNNTLKALAEQKNRPVAELSQDIHLLPYVAGNRTPRMDSRLTGVLAGYTLNSSEESLALLYLATIQALALEAKNNVCVLSNAGYQIDLLMAAGLSHNPLYIQEHVNCLGIRSTLSRTDPMIKSGALMVAIATKAYPSTEAAMKAFGQFSEIIKPNSAVKDFYRKKMEVFKALEEDQEKYDTMMNG